MRGLFIFLLLVSFSFGDDLSERLNKLIHDKSVKAVTILKYDPFFSKTKIEETYQKQVIAKKNIKKSKAKLRLICVFGDKAFIQNRWLGTNDKINGYKIKKILKNSVVLVKNNKKVILGFEKTKKILKVREK